MRFKSAKTDGLEAFAVTGVNTVAFAIKASDEAKKGLLGFAVERGVTGKKPSFGPASKCSTGGARPQGTDRRQHRGHPVQSFVWDDFTAEPATEYVYRFHPMRGTPKDARPPGRPRRDPRQDRATFQRKKSTTSSSTGASRAARPTRGSSATRSPTTCRPKKAAEVPALAEPGPRRSHAQVHRRRREGRRRCSAAFTNSATSRWPGTEGRHRPRRRRAGHHRRQGERAIRQEAAEANPAVPQGRQPEMIEDNRLPDGPRDQLAASPQEQHPPQQVHGPPEGQTEEADRSLDRDRRTSPTAVFTGKPTRSLGP